MRSVGKVSIPSPSIIEVTGISDGGFPFAPVWLIEPVKISASNNVIVYASRIVLLILRFSFAVSLAITQ
jgi:hypothetical protein